MQASIDRNSSNKLIKWQLDKLAHAKYIMTPPCPLTSKENQKEQART
jgi:hypothetical protein